MKGQTVQKSVRKPSPNGNGAQLGKKLLKTSLCDASWAEKVDFGVILGSGRDPEWPKSDVVFLVFLGPGGSGSTFLTKLGQNALRLKKTTKKMEKCGTKDEKSEGDDDDDDDNDNAFRPQNK